MLGGLPEGCLNAPGPGRRWRYSGPTVKPSPTLSLDETRARQVLLLRAFEADDSPPWTAADRDWATRVARASLADDAGVGALRRRTRPPRHAAPGPRDAGVRAALKARFAARPWALVALLAGLVLGLAVDQIGPAQRINLLAPPIWALVAWNLVVYLMVVVQALMPAAAARGLRAWLQRLWRTRVGKGAPLQRFAVDWAAATAPLDAARAAWLLHLAAAALAVGVVGGMYLRGLVLDYRAGWESTFLDAARVQPVLQALLAPASALTGIAVPDTAALAAQQLAPGQAAQAPAAPWLHLYAATLALFVIGPRLLLALWALTRIGWLRRHVAVAVDEPYFQQLLQLAEGRSAAVWLLPHAVPPAAAVALAVQGQLTALTGGAGQLRLADALPFGAEDDAARCTPPPGTTRVLVLVDLAATPEAEVHGRLLATLAASAGGTRRVLLADETAFAQRMGHAPERVAERRQAWQQLADAGGVPLVTAALGAASPAAAQALQRALGD